MDGKERIGGGAERWTGDGYGELVGLRLAGRRRTPRVSLPTRAVCVGPSYAASVPGLFCYLRTSGPIRPNLGVFSSPF